MPLTRVPRMEIESIDEFDRRIPKRKRLAGWTVQSVDLRGRTKELERVDVSGALFLGCDLDLKQEKSLILRGAFVFPSLPGQPFNPYRASLYTADDLYNASYPKSFDAQVYAWYMSLSTPPPVASSLAMSIHDHSIVEAFDDRLDPEAKVVGIMGGHAVRRGDATYRTAAELGSRLADAGFTVATGGGPGAMEAANLGARAGTGMDDAIAVLEEVPDFAPDVSAWVAPAMDITHDLPEGQSLGIPTWYYGHEPPNVFASMIAKLFSNAIREDMLLATCHAGIIYLPGAAGTVQEVFQAATRNYYAPDPSLTFPMIFLGKNYWTRELRVPEILTTLAKGKLMEHEVVCVDSPEDVVEVLTDLSSAKG